MWGCVIGMDDRLSIAFTDLSFALFSQLNKDISNIMADVEFDRHWKEFQTGVNVNLFE
jgi:hypothetical protein